MKKSFLLAGVILDIVVISLILITALNVINITNRTNSFLVENKLDILYKEAKDILAQVDRVSNFYFILNTKGKKIPIADNRYITLELEPFGYKREENVFTLSPLKEDNATARIQKVIVNVIDDKGRNILSIDKLIYE